MLKCCLLRTALDLTCYIEQILFINYRAEVLSCKHLLHFNLVHLREINNNGNNFSLVFAIT